MRKADLTSPMIMWLAVLMAVLIILPWYANNLKPLNSISKRIDIDLNEISTSIHSACLSELYTKKYNPVTETGSLTVNENKLCIITDSVTDCTQTVCDVKNTSLNLTKLTFVYIHKNQSGVELLDEQP